MSFQLRFSDATLDADLLDGSPGRLILEPTVRYALCRSMTVRPDGCMPLVVRDPKVSACHFTLSFLDGRWRVEDGNGSKGSTNGTLLDGEKIGSKLATLTPGSVLAAQGSMTSLYFEAAPVAATAETAAEATQTFSQEAADCAPASRGGVSNRGRSSGGGRGSSGGGGSGGGAVCGGARRRWRNGQPARAAQGGSTAAAGGVQADCLVSATLTL